MLNLAITAACALAASLAGSQVPQTRLAPKARVDVATVEAIVYAETTEGNRVPLAGIDVKIYPHGVREKVLPSPGTTSADGRFQVEVPLGTEWQLVDVWLEDNALYQSVVYRRQRRDDPTPREYAMNVRQAPGGKRLVEYVQELDDLRQEGWSIRAIQTALRTVRVLNATEFGADETAAGLAKVLDAELTTAAAQQVLTVQELPFGRVILFDLMTGRECTASTRCASSSTSPDLRPVQDVAGGVAFDATRGTAPAAVAARGTNGLRGTLSEQFEHANLRANNRINARLGRSTPQFVRNVASGSLGGPIKKNSAFFFLNYEHDRLSETTVTFLNVPPGTPDDAATAAGLALLRPKAGPWQRDQRVHRATLRSDVILPKSNQLSLSVNWQPATADNALSPDPQRSQENVGPMRSDALRTRMTLRSSRSGTLFNEAAWQWVYATDSRGANTTLPQASVFERGSQVLVIGRSDLSARDSESSEWQFSNTLDWNRGGHAVKFGATVSVGRIRLDQQDFFAGAYTFASIASSSAGRPAGEEERYQQHVAGPAGTGALTHPDVTEYGFFAQDNWRVTTGLTLNAGLRYDLQTISRERVRNPDPQLISAGVDTARVPADRNNVSPVVGLAWDATGNQRLMLHGGIGLSSSRVSSEMLSAAERYNGLNVLSVVVTGPAVPTYPASLSFDALTRGDSSGAASSVSRNIMHFGEPFETARVMTLSAGVQKSLLDSLAVSLTYAGAHSRHLARSVDRNVGPRQARTYVVEGTSQTVSYPYVGANPLLNAFGRVIAFESSAESRSDAITIDLRRRLKNGVMFAAAYTLARLTDTAPDATATVPGNAVDDAKYAPDPLDAEANRAPGSGDERHRFALNGTLDTSAIGRAFDSWLSRIATDWMITLRLTARSGRAFSARVGPADLNGDGNTRNDLAPGTTRNQFRLSGSTVLDAQLKRRIVLSPRSALTLSIEAFNLLNAEVVAAVDQAYYGVDLSRRVLTPNANFGVPILTVNERSLRLMGRFDF